MTDQPKRSRFATDSIAAPLRHAVFRRIWLASLVSNLGILIQGVGAGCADGRYHQREAQDWQQRLTSMMLAARYTKRAVSS